MRKRLWPVLVVLGFVQLAGELSACTASAVLYYARESEDSELVRLARDVAEELLDAEGIDPTTVCPEHASAGNFRDFSTSEAATGALLWEGATVADLSDAFAASTFLSRSSHANGPGGGHAPTPTVRAHTLLHAEQVVEWKLQYDLSHPGAPTTSTTPTTPTTTTNPPAGQPAAALLHRAG